jgi:hypothetical protein
MNKHITDRRIAFVKKYLMVRDVKVAAAEVLKLPEFSGDSIEVMRRDWSRRQRWLDAIVRVNDPAVLAEVLAEVRWVLDQAHIEYVRNPDETITMPTKKGAPTKELKISHSRDRVAALRAVREAAESIATLLIEAGIMKARPVTFNVTQTNLTQINIATLPEEERNKLVEAARILRVRRGESQS